MANGVALPSAHPGPASSQQCTWQCKAGRAPLPILAFKEDMLDREVGSGQMIEF